jgi:hypothetical protein
VPSQLPMPTPLLTAMRISRLASSAVFWKASAGTSADQLGWSMKAGASPTYQ